MTTEKMYIKDYWDDKTIVLGEGRKGLIAIGEVLADGGERFIHIKKLDLLKFIKKIDFYEAEG